MKSIKQVFSNKNKKLFFRYLIISVLSYTYTFLGLFLLIEKLNFDERISFIIIYGIAYLILYNIQLKYLFYKKHDSSKLSRYISSIIIFYLSANLIYNLGLFVGIPYLISTALTILILIPLRLFVYTYYVYKN